jgi:hypothetical protein
MIRSPEERRQQIKDYDEQAPLAGTRFADIKVWESSSERDHRFAAMERQQFDETAAKLALTVP